jgi:hemerythrin
LAPAYCARIAEKHGRSLLGYPDFAQYKALHDKIRKKTSDLREHAHLVTGHDLLRVLKEWWVGHIQSLDKKYAPYLELSGSHH